MAGAALSKMCLRRNQKAKIYLVRSITQAPPPAKRQNQKRIRHHKSEEVAENAVEDAGGPL